MKKHYPKTITIVFSLFASLSLIPFSQAQPFEYKITFQLLDRPYGDVIYELNVTIPELLYQYYNSKSHIMYSERDFAKFITPYTLKPIADRLWEIYDTEEDFTNGVLMLVQQITYEETIPGKYPVETLVEGKGDCDLFVFIAASVLYAGGIDSVLLYYKEQLHMQLGVQLADAPKDARSDVYYVEYQGTKYYIAETTGGRWREGWRVGECPTDYRNASVQVVPLQNIEQMSIGQVLATLKELEPSTIILESTPSIVLESFELLIRGKILQKVANQNVTLYVKINNTTWTTIGKVETQSDGQFEYLWKPNVGGSVIIRASWPGNMQFNGAMSEEVNLYIIPLFLVVAVVGSAIVVTICIVVFFLFKTPKTRTNESQFEMTLPSDNEPPREPA
jgi:uncharacterized membrane protein